MYRKKNKLDVKEVLEKAAGIWKDRKGLPPTQEYIRLLRKDSRRKRYQIS